MAETKIYIEAFDAVCACGGIAGIKEAIFGEKRTGLTWQETLAHRALWFGKVDDAFVSTDAEIAEYFPHMIDSPLIRIGRSDRLLARSLINLQASIEGVCERYGRNRVAVVLGASVSGMTEMENAYGTPRLNALTDRILEINNPAKFVQAAFQLGGPAYVISTACSSSAKAMASAARLLKAGLADAVITGGIDPYSRFTIAGFDSLGALSHALTQPFADARDGINLGEGGALFLLTREVSDFELAGWGETSDAYHISSPDPAANSVKCAMRDALQMAGLETVDYVNAHGTGTPHNDAMESGAIHEVIGSSVPVSSTKALTGHTLGGAGALEAAICLIALKENRLPRHFTEEAIDETMPKLNWVNEARSTQLATALSNSFAFGGNNAVLVLKKVRHG